MWLCGAKRRAKGILWLQLSGCPELTEVREEAYGCIRGYTELAGVQEGALAVAYEAIQSSQGCEREPAGAYGAVQS